MNVFEIISTKYEIEWLNGQISFVDENDGNGPVINVWDLDIPRPSTKEILSYETEVLPAFILTQLKKKVIILIENLLENTAKSKGYDSALSCSSYFNSSVPQWKQEAELFMAWRDNIWAYSIQEFEKVRLETRPIISLEEFLTELPIINW